MSKEELINSQASLIRALQKDNEKWQKEAFLLKRSIREAMSFMAFNLPAEISLEVEPQDKETWLERSEHYESLRGQLLNVAVRLIKMEGAAIHQDRIINAFAMQLPKVFKEIKSPGETLPRRLRELRQAKWLTSPVEGVYFLGPKVVETTKL